MGFWVSVCVGLFSIMGWLSLSLHQSKTEEYENSKQK